MASIDLPRPIQDYFAFAETTPTREGRRFSITLPYLSADGRIDRLQWWYHLSEGREKVLGEEALRGARAEAIERFTTHIEFWLHNTVQILRGDGPIPQLSIHGANGAALPVVASPGALPVQAAAEPAKTAGQGAVTPSAEVPEQTAPAAEPAVQVSQSKAAFG